MLLGPDSVLLDLCPEQQFSSQKMRPGSGVLSVQVLPDGPTRVLQVHNDKTSCDIMKCYNTDCLL